MTKEKKIVTKAVVKTTPAKVTKPVAKKQIAVEKAVKAPVKKAVVVKPSVAKIVKPVKDEVAMVKPSVSSKPTARPVSNEKISFAEAVRLSNL